MKKQFYSLPELTYAYGDLAPHISAEQLMIHHQKHHQAYVTAANAILEKFDQARQEDKILDYKSELKSLSFNLGGHMLHSLFWKNLMPEKQGGGKVQGEIASKINEDFGGFARFKNEFTAVAASLEGSGWGALVYHPALNRLMCFQIEKHNFLFTPGLEVLLVVDVFEHAYYLDYKQDRGKFIEAFWNIVNWAEVNKRFNKK